jgi:hypothetical protein
LGPLPKTERKRKERCREEGREEKKPEIKKFAAQCDILKKKKNPHGVVVHSYSPSYSGGGDRRISAQSQTWAKLAQDPI